MKLHSTKIFRDIVNGLGSFIQSMFMNTSHTSSHAQTGNHSFSPIPDASLPVILLPSLSQVVSPLIPRASLPPSWVACLWVGVWPPNLPSAIATSGFLWWSMYRSSKAVIRLSSECRLNASDHFLGLPQAVRFRSWIFVAYWKWFILMDHCDAWLYLDRSAYIRFIETCINFESDLLCWVQG